MVRLAFVVVAVALGGYALARRWDRVGPALIDIGAPTAAGALVAVAAGLLATMQVWRGLLAGLGSPLPLAAAARIFFIGQLGKYIPGSMWPILAQMDLAAPYRVPRRRSATAALLTMLICLCAGLVAALTTLPLFVGRSTVEESVSGRAGYGWVFGAAPVLLVLLHPRLLNPVLRRLSRLVRRPAPEQPLAGRVIVTALGWALLSWVLLGAHVWLLATRLGAPTAATLPLAVGGFAFAWSAGFLVVIAPAGAGVRDLLLIATLSPVLSVGPATAVTLVSRAAMTGGDLLLAGLAAITRRPPARN
jgi:hypothetical protein